MQSINVSELKDFLAHDTADNTLVIDVRTPAEYQRERIMGVANMPLDDLEKHVADLQDYEHVYVHCASGNRSTQACAKLNTLGLDNLINVEGGLGAWNDAGFHTVEDKSAPLPIMQQVQIVAGSLVVIGVLLSLMHPVLIVVSAFVGAGLVFAGITGTCTMGLILARMPWNQRP